MADTRQIYEDVKGAHYFTDYHCGTNTHYNEITLGEYDKMKKIEETEGHRGLYDYVLDNYVSDATKWGYGYYGATLLVLGGVPYLGIESGNTCD